MYIIVKMQNFKLNYKSLRQSVQSILVNIDKCKSIDEKWNLLVFGSKYPSEDLEKVHMYEQEEF